MNCWFFLICSDFVANKLHMAINGLAISLAYLGHIVSNGPFSGFKNTFYQTGDVPIRILDQSKAVSTNWKEQRWSPVLPCLLIMTRTWAVEVRLEPNCLFSLAIVHKHITLAPFCSWTNEVYKYSHSANVWYHRINMLNTILFVTKTGLTWDATWNVAL